MPCLSQYELLNMFLLVKQLETAIASEMDAFKEEWEAVLDELETESSHLLVCFSLQS